jgi:hypothetical protein
MPAPFTKRNERIIVRFVIERFRERITVTGMREGARTNAACNDLGPEGRAHGLDTTGI